MLEAVAHILCGSYSLPPIGILNKKKNLCAAKPMKAEDEAGAERA